MTEGWAENRRIGRKSIERAVRSPVFLPNPQATRNYPSPTLNKGCCQFTSPEKQLKRLWTQGTLSIAGIRVNPLLKTELRKSLLNR